MTNNIELKSPPITADKSAKEDRKSRSISFVPLSEETRAAVNTACAAFHLSRAEQTLRIWACKESGPLNPRRISGRLSWQVADLRRVLGVA